MALDPTPLPAGVESTPRRKIVSYVGIALANRVIPKARTKVVLHSLVDVDDGVIAIIEELRARGWAATVLLEDRRREASVRAMTKTRVRTVPKKSVSGILQFLTARYVFTTEDVFGGFKPPSAQTLVMLWHGEPPTKVTSRFAGRPGLHGSYAPVCSTLGRAYRSAEFDIHPLRVPIVGAPRNDRMLRADGSRVRRQLLGPDADKTVLVWLPSFRVGRVNRLRVDSAGVIHPGLPFSAEDLQQLDGWLTAHDTRLVVKLHPHDLKRLSGDYKAIRVVDDSELLQHGLTLYTALPAFDGLITDVSSVWVDYLLLDKPMIFAFPDMEDYRRGRGLNLEPYEEWVPGPFAHTMDDLIRALGDLGQGRDTMAEERRRARARFHRFHDDRSAARLLDVVGLSASLEEVDRPGS